MNLEDEDPELFGIFYQWTLFKALGSRKSRVLSTTLVRIWFIADRFLCSTLQNAAMFELCKPIFDANKLEKSCIDYVFKITSKGHPLYEILIDGLAEKWKEDGVFEIFEGYSSDILYDMMVRVRLFEGRRWLVKAYSNYCVPDSQQAITKSPNKNRVFSLRNHLDEDETAGMV